MNYKNTIFAITLTIISTALYAGETLIAGYTHKNTPGLPKNINKIESLKEHQLHIDDSTYIYHTFMVFYNNNVEKTYSKMTTIKNSDNEKEKEEINYFRSVITKTKSFYSSTSNVLIFCSDDDEQESKEGYLSILGATKNLTPWDQIK